MGGLCLAENLAESEHAVITPRSVCDSYTSDEPPAAGWLPVAAWLHSSVVLRPFLSRRIFFPLASFAAMPDGETPPSMYATSA